MKKLLLISASLLALGGTAQATVIGDLGVNPTSAQGAFDNGNLPTGLFEDQWTFQVAGNQLLTIGSATNVFPQTSDFIAGFNGSVYEIVGAIGPGGGADTLVLGPAFAGPCGDNCQVFGGSALLDTGNYYLNIAGNAGSTAGYGGDLAVITPAVPELSTWAMMILGFASIVFMGARNRRREGGRSFRLA